MHTEEEIFRKELMEKDALNRIKFDKNLKPKDFDILYAERNSQELVKVNFSEIEIEGDFFRYKNSLIPMHRIRKILQKGKVVWDRRKLFR